jgi:hypothetical protein
MTKRLGGALALALTMSAVAAASAFATAPELVVKSVTNIQSQGGSITLETGAASIKCAGAAGIIENSGYLELKEFTNSYTFRECKGTVKGRTAENCTTAGSPGGTIKTNTIKSRLFYLSKATKEVGLLLNYKPSGEVATFETFSCSVIGFQTKVTVRGTVLAKMSPINTLIKQFALTLAGSKGIPTLKEYENESGVKVAAKLESQYSNTLETSPWEAANFNSSSLEWVMSNEGRIVA